MSLKAFHIVFIGLSILLALGMATWSVIGYFRGGDAVYFLGALLSLMCAGGLTYYSVRFLRKLRGVSFF